MISTRFRLSALALAAMLATGGAAAQTAANYVPPQATVPMNRIVQDNAYQQLDYFFKKLVAEKEAIVIDGYAPFKAGDKFLPGKVAAGLGHVLLNSAKDDPALPQKLRDYRDIADMTVGMDNHTWGIYYYIGTLVKLKEAGLLEQAVSPATLEKLRKQLDWRTFVTVPQYDLINLPTNYYGVAFSIARLRMLMGWEDDSGSKILLDKMLTHYKKYSGKFGFSDETDGEGRFDRYSILLIAEICERFLETGMEPTPELKGLLRKAADIALNVSNAAGDGFSFGRSLGPYGETALVEILSVSAYLDVLTAEEKQYAYAFSSRVAARYMDFWYDPSMHSLDMWGKGRRTDTYRGKHRILGENFSLLHQLIYTNDTWNKAGMKDAPPKADLQAWLDKNRPQFSTTTFAQGEYDRALTVFRDGKHVVSLNIINGGISQHDNSPYYPLPFAPGIVSGIADSGSAHPQLLPKFTMADGAQLIGTAWIKDIKTSQAGQRYTVSYRQDELDRLGKKSPVKDGRIKLQTTYTLEHGQLTRNDVYTPVGTQEVEKITLEFASFSEQPAIEGSTVTFAKGDVDEYSVSGLQQCQVAPTNGSKDYMAPYGAMKTLVTCSTGKLTMKEPLTIKWTIKYH
ncbi:MULTISPECIES: hypothetical protein [unclassified Duganella]|uniref:hypothetical protein n=1 Tax=unclassified Duganella TaxID=2636909 RepID=UPI000E3573AE|nr:MULTISPECIES: hypothetical protein [unclassified Duganella]RFP11333.1 hypothetical protein D0T23_20670 [Duganella sp. BJB475]RFP29652.1 hypothetical protein D0T21_17425 [Duganella sp. BJB476]